jgi:hypothetical protein
MDVVSERHDQEAEDITRLSNPENILHLMRSKFSSHTTEGSLDLYFVEPTRYESRVWACFENFIQVRIQDTLVF